MLNNIIVKMSGNSFVIKGWSITVECALIALDKLDIVVFNWVIIVLPLLLFWFLDTFLPTYGAKIQSHIWLCAQE